MNSISKVAWKEQINLRWVRWIFRKQTPWRIFFIRDHGHVRSVPHVAFLVCHMIHTQRWKGLRYICIELCRNNSNHHHRPTAVRCHVQQQISPIPRYWPIINLLKSVLPLNCHVNYFHIAKNLLRYVLNCEKNISNH